MFTLVIHMATQNILPFIHFSIQIRMYGIRKYGIPNSVVLNQVNRSGNQGVMSGIQELHGQWNQNSPCNQKYPWGGILIYAGWVLTAVASGIRIPVG